MPKFKDFLPWTKKKVHGSKYHEFHGYDNIRHSGYPTTPPTINGHHHPHLQQQFQHPHHQLQPPPHSLSHKHQIYPQQIIMQAQHPPAYLNNRQQHQLPQSPQQQQQIITNHQHLVAPPSLVVPQNQALIGVATQCACQHCSIQQTHHNNSQQQQQMQQSFSTNQNFLSSTNATQSQLMMSPQHMNQQQQQLPTTPSIVQTDVAALHQPFQGNHQSIVCQHQQPPPTQQPSINCQGHTHNYVNHPSQHSAPYQQSSTQHQQQQVATGQVTQCVCLQHCPYQHHTNGHQQQIDCSPLNADSSVNNQCQHQLVMNQQVAPSLQASNQHIVQQVPPNNQTYTSQVTTINQQNISGPVVPASSTPNNFQPHQQFVSQYQTNHQVVSQHQHQQQSDPVVQQQSTQNNQFLTIQPNQYQQSKQHYAQQQHQQHQHMNSSHQQPSQQQISNIQQQNIQSHHHQRVQSLHQQQFRQRSPQPLHMQPFSHSQMQIPAYQNQQPIDQSPYSNGIEANESSRYANMPIPFDLIKSSPQKTTTATGSSHSTKFEDHVYCNHNQKFILPPYNSPPDYDTYMEHRNMYDPVLANERQSTCNSESLLMQRTKDSGYENLKETYYNFSIRHQDSGLTS